MPARRPPNPPRSEGTAPISCVRLAQVKASRASIRGGVPPVQNQVTRPPVLPNIRLSRPALADVSLFKTFPIHERLQFQLRGEAFNIANTAWFPAPNTSFTSPAFGKTLLGTGGFGATSNDPRAIQLSARIQF